MESEADRPKRKTLDAKIESYTIIVTDTQFGLQEQDRRDTYKLIRPNGPCFLVQTVHCLQNNLREMFLQPEHPT
jgi:hypothetical protein